LHVREELWKVGGQFLAGWRNTLEEISNGIEWGTLAGIEDCVRGILAQAVPLEARLGNLAAIFVSRRRIKLPKPAFIFCRAPNNAE
jgi:hypothetical protein